MRQIDLFSESELNKHESANSVLADVIGRFNHDFIRRTTKINNAELFVCKHCGATKNILNKDSKCIDRPKPFGIERFLNAL